MSYERIICDQTRQDAVFMKYLGYYQGEWVLFTHSNGTFSLYEGGYGSCSGCDEYEAKFYAEPVIDSDDAIEFVGDYGTTKRFTRTELEEYAKKDSTLHGFVPIDLRGYHDEDYDTSITEGLRACLAFEG